MKIAYIGDFSDHSFEGLVKIVTILKHNLSKKYPNAKFEVVIETSRRGKLITRRLRCVNGKEVEIS